MSDVTQILSQIEQGNRAAADQLLPLVYDELRQMAARKMAHEAPGHTLQATALVHEAYIRLVDADRVRGWDSRGHFFMAATEAMRRILVENARRKSRRKHGGDRRRIDLDQLSSAADASSDELLALDEALNKLAANEPAQAELIRLRYFGGFTIDEAARLLEVSPATAKRYWTYARAWLYAEISEPHDASQD
jgi:RNA polymerase sigma factor (TIGR02999 family)